MRSPVIDFAQPFEQVFAPVVSLPRGCTEAQVNALEDEAEFKQVIRGLYEAANGRHVETGLGVVAIAPPVAPFLKAQPFQVASQIDLLVEPATRIIAGSALCGAGGDNTELPRPTPPEQRCPPLSAP